MRPYILVVMHQVICLFAAQNMIDFYIFWEYIAGLWIESLSRGGYIYCLYIISSVVDKYDMDIVGRKGSFYSHNQLESRSSTHSGIYKMMIG